MTDLLAIAERIARALETAGFDHVLGGAVALAAYTPPRATLDLDFGVRATPAQLPALIAALEGAGCVVPENALERAQRGDFGARLDGVRIDIFLPATELAEAALDRRVEHELGGRRLSLASPEDLVLLKLLFHRTKDRADLERLFALRGRTLDYDYLDAAVGRQFSGSNDQGRRADYVEFKRMTEIEIRARIHALRVHSGLVSALAALDEAIDRMEAEWLALSRSLAEAEAEQPGLESLVRDSHGRALEALCGAGFVVAAEQIDRLERELRALASVRGSPPVVLSAEVRQVRAVANLFKHEAEWAEQGGWSKADARGQRTIRDLPAGLADGQPDNLRRARDTLGRGTLRGLTDRVDAWRDEASA